MPDFVDTSNVAEGANEAYQCPACGALFSAFHVRCSAQVYFTYIPAAANGGAESFGPYVLDDGSEGDPFSVDCPACGMDFGVYSDYETSTPRVPVPGLSSDEFSAMLDAISR